MKHFRIMILSFFFLFQLSCSYSQEKVNIHISDNSGKPIPYASVIWSNSLGLVSDISGNLQILDRSRIDSLIISAIGYKERIIMKETLIDTASLEIILERSEIDLPEIIVAKYNMEKELGCVDANRQTSYIKNAICSNLQGAFLIKSYNYPAQCKSISVFIAKQSSFEIPYRLRLYEIGEDALPGKDLLSDNLIVQSYRKNSWNTYSLDSISIQLPKNGFFVAIEWLCTDIKSENGLCVGLTSKIDESLTFYKYGNTGWIQLKHKTGISKDNIMMNVKITSTK